MQNLAGGFRKRNAGVSGVDAGAKRFIEELYRANYDKMFRYAYRLAGEAEKAEELVQETFALALLHERELVDHPNPTGWLFVTLKYQIMNERRRKAPASEVPLEGFFSLEAEPLKEPLDAMLPRELTESERRLLIWRFEERIGYEEMSERLGITQNACRIRVMRAVEKCRRYWD